MYTPEKIEKLKVKKYLKSIGAWNFSPHMAGRGGSGVPDIIACIKGTFWGIEVKREGGKLTTLQEARLNQINANGGCSACGTADVIIGAIEWWLGQRQTLPPGYRVCFQESMLSNGNGQMDQRQ